MKNEEYHTVGTIPKNEEYHTVGTIPKNEEYHTVGTIPKSNIKIIERDKIDTHDKQIHDSSHSWLDTSLKSGEIKVVL